MKNVSLKNFEAKEVSTEQLTNLKGGNPMAGWEWTAFTNTVVFGGTGTDSWLYNIVNSPEYHGPCSVLPNDC